MSDVQRLFFASVICLQFFAITILACLLVQLKAEYDDIYHMCQVAEQKVEEHEKIMKAYEFFNWQYSLKMDTSDLEDE